MTELLGSNPIEAQRDTERAPLVLFAIDSADARLLETWARSGHLPTLASVIARGTSARLEGPEMCSENGIWVSLLSGLSRGQHGYYYWRPLDPGTYQLKLSDQDCPEAPPFWALSSSGLRVAVFDVPETHCALGTEGVQVANWGPHNARFRGYSVPQPLFADLCRRFGSPSGVEERVGSSPKQDLRIHRALLRQIEQKSAICHYLLEDGAFDVIVIGFHEVHIAGHQFHTYGTESSKPLTREASTTKTEATDPEISQKLANATREVYQAIDRLAGDVLERLPANSTIAFLSNMGIEQDYPSLELTQAFCQELGYMHRPVRAARVSLARQLSPQRLARKILPKDWQRAISERLPDDFHARMLTQEWLGGTDWSKTTVFPVPSYFLGFLRVNLVGREPQGTVRRGAEYLQLLDRVATDLEQLIDPVTGDAAVRSIVRAVDLYGPDPPEVLPDIFFDWQPTPHPKQRVLHPHAVLEQKDLFFSRGTRHDTTGFFAIAGPQVAARGRIGDRSVLDVAPSLLRILNRSIPSTMGGSVIERLFS